MKILTVAFLLALTLCTERLTAAPKLSAEDQADLANNKPMVDPDADAEIIIKDVYLDQSSWFGSNNSYKVRVKLYTQRGVEKFTKVELDYDDRSYLCDIAARTIQPDGKILELASRDVYDRQIIKANNVRLRAKSFAPPGLQPGAILEYTYTEVTKRPTIWAELPFQASVPSRLVRYRLKLLQLQDYDVCALSFNCPSQPLKLSPNGECFFEMTNTKAAPEEPFGPPGINTQATILMYRTWSRAGDATSDQYWGIFSKKWHDELDNRAKPTKPIQAALASIVSKGDDQETILRKIYDFCRTKIVSRDNNASGLTRREVEKLKENDTAADVLKVGNGTHDDYAKLFAALARAAGLEAQFVLCNDRTRINFNPKLMVGLAMMDDLAVAVRTTSGWRYFDPGALYLPFATLSPWNSDTMVVHCDKSGTTTPIPHPGPEADASELVRKADFKLDAEGGLDGSVTETYSGYLDATMKWVLDDKGPTEREKLICDRLQEYQKEAELTDIVIENPASPTAPLKISYHLRIPNYASRTNSRLILQPAVFQKGTPPWFESETREYTIMFPHRYATRDEITISTPSSFKLETATTPGGVDMAPVGDYTASVSINRETGVLTYKRRFMLTSLTFAKKYYQRIKAMFDEVSLKDSLTVSLKTNEPDAQPATPAP